MELGIYGSALDKAETLVDCVHLSLFPSVGFHGNGVAYTQTGEPVVERRQTRQIRTLSAKQAEGLIARFRRLRLVDFNEVQADKVYASQKKSAPLYLDALASLTPEVAEALAGHSGGLHLDGLTTLTPEVAEALVKNSEELSLDGIASLTPEVANVLGRKSGWGLSLDGLTLLTTEVAESLAKYKGGLWLDGLTTLTPEVAAALAKTSGGLSLDGLTTLTPAVAAALANYSYSWGMGLSIGGLATLTPEVAAALAKSRGRLSLSGLTTLSPNALAALQANPEIRLPKKIQTSLPNKEVQRTSAPPEASQATVTEADRPHAAIEPISAQKEPSPSVSADSMTWFMGMVAGLVAVLVVISLAMR